MATAELTADAPSAPSPRIGPLNDPPEDKEVTGRWLHGFPLTDPDAPQGSGR